MKIFPVVHIDNINDLKVAKRDSNRAFELGSDGIYLINHRSSGIGNIALFETFNSIKEISADRYVGLNILGSEPCSAMRVLTKALGKGGDLVSPPEGLFIYDIRTDSRTKSAMEYKKNHPKLQRVRLLGGIAINDEGTYVRDPDMARRKTAYLEGLVDVVMTSGREMGEEPPTVEKLLAMRKGMGDKPLAVIGGISAENIDQYKGIVDEVLVNARGEKGYGVFDVDKLKELIRVAHSLAK